MSGKSPVVAMTDAGFATVLGAGKVRWTPIAGGNSTETIVENAIISSGSNTVVTQMAVSRDSEWLAVARYVTSAGSTAGVTTVSLLKLKGGDGTEITLNTKETGASFSNVSSLFVDSRKGSQKTVYIGDKSGVLFSCQITSTGLGSGQNAAPHIVAKSLGPITSITGLDGSVYAAINDGVTLVKIDPASGVQQDQWPMTAYPPIRRLAVLPSLKAVVVGARHRHLTLHSLDHSFESQTLACDDKPLQVDANTHRQGSVHHFLCLSESGAINIFKYSKPSKTPLQPAGTIKLDPSSTKGHTILSARFCGSNQILVAYGTHVKPVFKKITYVNAKTDEIAKESTVLSDETGLLLGNTAETNGDASSKTPQKTKTKTVSGDNVHVSGMKSDLNTKVEELTFAERLGQPAASKTPEKSAGKVGVAASADGKVPKVASNVAVLSAALASNDRQQLQTVLDQQDQRVISATVKGLPLSSILPLLLELMNRFSRKPAANTAAWLRYVLITHQAYLTSLPNLINRLSGLYNTLDDRLKYFPDLLRLHGRFELVLSHMELNKSASADDTAPFNTYVEGADDEDFDEDSDDDVDDDEEFDDDDDDEDDEEEGAGRKKPEDMDVDSDEQDEKQSGSDEDDSEGSDE